MAPAYVHAADCVSRARAATLRCARTREKRSRAKLVESQLTNVTNWPLTANKPPPPPPPSSHGNGSETFARSLIAREHGSRSAPNDAYRQRTTHTQPVAVCRLVRRDAPFTHACTYIHTYGIDDSVGLASSTTALAVVIIIVIITAALRHDFT